MVEVRDRVRAKDRVRDRVKVRVRVRVQCGEYVVSTAAGARVRAALMTGTAWQSAGRRPHVVRGSGCSHTLMDWWLVPER